MTKMRLFAWLVMFGVIYTGSYVYRTWSNPWASAKSPVLSMLPAAAPGCGESCKK